MTRGDSFLQFGGDNDERVLLLLSSNRNLSMNGLPTGAEEPSTGAKPQPRAVFGRGEVTGL